MTSRRARKVNLPLLRQQLRSSRYCDKNFTTKLPRTTLGTGLARTGTNTGMYVHHVRKESLPSREPRGKTPPHRASVARHGRLHVAAGRESGERRRRESGQCVPRQAAASPPASRRHGSHAHPGGVTRRHPAPDCNARPGCDQSSLSLLLLPLRHPPRPRAPQVVYGATLLGHDAVATQAQSSPPPLKPITNGR